MRILLGQPIAPPSRDSRGAVSSRRATIDCWHARPTTRSSVVREPSSAPGSGYRRRDHRHATGSRSENHSRRSSRTIRRAKEASTASTSPEFLLTIPDGAAVSELRVYHPAGPERVRIGPSRHNLAQLAKEECDVASHWWSGCRGPCPGRGPERCCGRISRGRAGHERATDGRLIDRVDIVVSVTVHRRRAR